MLHGNIEEHPEYAEAKTAWDLQRKVVADLEIKLEQANNDLQQLVEENYRRFWGLAPGVLVMYRQAGTRTWVEAEFVELELKQLTVSADSVLAAFTDRPWIKICPAKADGTIGKKVCTGYSDNWLTKAEHAAMLQRCADTGRSAPDTAYLPQTDSRYPDWVCSKCGDKYGRRNPTDATWANGICGVCIEAAPVTEPRDYGHLKIPICEVVKK